MTTCANSHGYDSARDLHTPLKSSGTTSASHAVDITNARDEHHPRCSSMPPLATEIKAIARTIGLNTLPQEPNDAIDAGIAAALSIHIDASLCDGAPAGVAFEPPSCAASQPCAYDEGECFCALQLLRAELRLDDAAPIIALALIERCILATPDQRLVTPVNWRAVLGTAISLAHKMVSDEPPPSSVIGAVASAALREPALKLGALEAHMSRLLGFQLHVSTLAFFGYHAALQELGEQRLCALAAERCVDARGGSPTRLQRDDEVAHMTARRESSTCYSDVDLMAVAHSDDASDDDDDDGSLFQDWC